MPKKNKIMLPVIVTLSLVLSSGLLSCDKKQNSSAASPQKEKTMAERVDELKTDVLVLYREVYNLGSGSAIVSTEEKGYSIAQTKYGAFAVSCKNVIPYLDGYKIVLDIGNLTSARFNGAKLSVNWGKANEHKKEISVTNNFPPGRYTPVELVLTPAKPEEIKTFNVVLEFNQMALY